LLCLTLFSLLVDIGPLSEIVTESPMSHPQSDQGEIRTRTVVLSQMAARPETTETFCPLGLSLLLIVGQIAVARRRLVFIVFIVNSLLP
jgi:hypothetical protein